MKTARERLKEKGSQKKERIAISIMITPEELEILKQHALKEGRNKSNAFKNIIRDFLDKQQEELR